MPKTKHVTDAQALENYRVALENVINQSEVSNTMAEFGYDEAKITEGKQLLEGTRSAYDFNSQEDNETIAARAGFDSKKMDLEKIYALDRKKAKVVFRNDEVVLKKLGLTGSVPQAYIKWLETMKTFYSGVQADSAIQTKLLTLKITAEHITASIAAITDLENARTLYLKEVGESQDATKAKDSAFAKIDAWMRDFYAVARIAMEDNPQLLESLGLMVRS